MRGLGIILTPSSTPPPPGQGGGQGTGQGCVMGYRQGGAVLWDTSMILLY